MSNFRKKFAQHKDDLVRQHIESFRSKDDRGYIQGSYIDRDKLPEAIVEKTITSYQLKKAHSDLNQAF